jgi:hypothetical protein
VDTTQKEAVCTTFLAIASRDLQEGRFMHGLAIFRSISKIEFSWQRAALQGEAVALTRVGQSKDALAESERKFKSLVGRFDKPTVSKADTLKSLAEVSIVLEHYDEIDSILTEAADIYTEQGLTKANGSIVHLQGLVALAKGDIQAAMEKFEWAKTLSEIKIPEIVPFGFGIEAPAEAKYEPASTQPLVGSLT